MSTIIRRTFDLCHPANGSETIERFDLIVDGRFIGAFLTSTEAQEAADEQQEYQDLITGRPSRTLMHVNS